MNQSCAKWKPSISSVHPTLTENTFLHRPVVSLFWSLSVYSLKDPNCVSVESVGKSGGCVYAFFFSVFFSSLNQGIFQHAQTVWGCICVFVSNKTSKWSWIKIILYKRLVQICCQLHIQKFPLSLRVQPEPQTGRNDFTNSDNVAAGMSSNMKTMLGGPASVSGTLSEYNQLSEVQPQRDADDFSIDGLYWIYRVGHLFYIFDGNYVCWEWLQSVWVGAQRLGGCLPLGDPCNSLATECRNFGNQVVTERLSVQHPQPLVSCCNYFNLIQGRKNCCLKYH